MSVPPLQITDLDFEQIGDCLTTDKYCKIRVTAYYNRPPSPNKCQALLEVIFKGTPYDFGWNVVVEGNDTKQVFEKSIIEYYNYTSRLKPGTYDITVRLSNQDPKCNWFEYHKDFTFVVKEGRPPSTTPLKPVAAEMKRQYLSDNKYRYWLRIHFNRPVAKTDQCSFNLGFPNNRGGYSIYLTTSLPLGKSYIDIEGINGNYNGNIMVQLECWVNGCGTCAKGQYILKVKNPYVEQPPEENPPEEGGENEGSNVSINGKTIAVIGGALGLLYFLKRRKS